MLPDPDRGELQDFPALCRCWWDYKEIAVESQSVIDEKTSASCSLWLDNDGRIACDSVTRAFSINLTETEIRRWVSCPHARRNVKGCHNHQAKDCKTLTHASILLTGYDCSDDGCCQSATTLLCICFSSCHATTGTGADDQATGMGRGGL